jgi:hypothetical protein
MAGREQRIAFFIRVGNRTSRIAMLSGNSGLACSFLHPKPDLDQSLSNTFATKQPRE